MFRSSVFRLTGLLLVMSMLTLSCSKEDEQDPIEKMIDEVKKMTAGFHDIEVAKSAGWAVDLSGCVQHPTEGGMGHHFARLEYLDGRINYLEPQVLLYEPRADGGFNFVGVEYIVPFDFIPSTADAPVLFDHQFHANEALGFWALHVWTERENPRGMFNDWNPNVSCN